MSLHYLKSTIKAEPLIWRWYAWSYLIPPATAAANIVERHLKIMQSYAQNPQIHAQAVKDPKMLGGPFINYETNRVEKIKELIALTKQECQPLDEVYLNVAFADKKLDQLFQMKEEPSDLAEVIQMFDVSSLKQPLFESFFTTTPPLKSEDRNYQGEGIRLRYFGHACMLLQTKSVSILFDPVLSYPIQGSDIPRYTFADLPDRIDYAIITHNHQDHLIFETLLQLRHKIKHLVFPANYKGSLQDPSIKLILQHTGFDSLIELNELQTISLEDGQIIGLPFFGEHSDLNIQTKLSYCVKLKLKGKALMFAADSNNLDPFLYDHIIDYTGSIDMLFLGMECDGAPLSWLYVPLLSAPLNRGFDRNRTLSGSNFEKAWAIVEKLQCKQVYIYAMGQEPWLHYVMALQYSPVSIQITESNKLIESCQSEGVVIERLFGKKEWMLT